LSAYELDQRVIEFPSTALTPAFPSVDETVTDLFKATLVNPGVDDEDWAVEDWDVNEFVRPN
jgi:hypothetical protein